MDASEAKQLTRGAYFIHEMFETEIAQAARKGSHATMVTVEVYRPKTNISWDRKSLDLVVYGLREKGFLVEEVGGTNLSTPHFSVFEAQKIDFLVSWF